MDPKTKNTTVIAADSGWYVSWVAADDGPREHMPVVGWRIEPDGYGEPIIVRNCPGDDVHVVGLAEAIEQEMVPDDDSLGIYHPDLLPNGAKARAA